MNQFFYIQTDGNHPIAKITAMDQNDHSNDSNWILVAVPQYELTAFQNHWQECHYNFNTMALDMPDDFAADAAIPSNGSGIVSGINKRLDTLTAEVNGDNFLAPKDTGKYGVMWNRGAGNTLNNGMTRIDDAKGMSSKLINGHNDFDEAGPFQFTRVTDDKGNAFMRIYRLYIKKTKTGSEDNGTITWEVSSVPFPGAYLPRCFVEYDSNSNPIGVLPYVDVACYDAGLNGNLLTSTSGVAPLVNNGIDNFRQFARNNGQGYQLLDIHVWDMLRTLFVIEFATLQSDSVFRGIRKGNSHDNSGETDGISAPSGSVSSGAFKYRGIENMYSNICQWMDGLNFDLQTGTKMFVCDDANKYQSQCYAYPYQLVGYNWHWGNAKDEGLDKAHPEVNLNENGDSGTNHSYYCDWQGGYVGNTVPSVGGNTWDSTNNGIFNLHVGTPSTAWPSGGARLVRKA